MSNAAIVAVTDSLDYLLENSLRFLFRQPSARMWFQVTVQTTTWNVFHHKNNIFLRINNFEETNDVKTMHFLHKFNFSFDRLSAIWVHQLVLFVNFHRHFSIWRLMQTYSDNGICPLLSLFFLFVVEFCIIYAKEDRTPIPLSIEPNIERYLLPSRAYRLS